MYSASLIWCPAHSKFLRNVVIIPCPKRGVISEGTTLQCYLGWAWLVKLPIFSSYRGETGWSSEVQLGTLPGPGSAGFLQPLAGPLLTHWGCTGTD